MKNISELDTSVALEYARTPSATNEVANILQSFFGKDLGLEVLKRLLDIEMVSAKADIRARLACKLGALGYDVVKLYYSFVNSLSKVVTGGTASARISMYSANEYRRRQRVLQYHSHSSMAAVILDAMTSDRVSKCVGVCLDGIPVSWLFVDYGEKITLSSSYHAVVHLDPKHRRLYESAHDGTVKSVTMPLPWLRLSPRASSTHAVAALSYPLYLSVKQLERDFLVVKIQDSSPSLGPDFAAAHMAFLEGRRAVAKSGPNHGVSCSDPAQSLIWNTVDTVGDRLSFCAY